MNRENPGNATTPEEISTAELYEKIKSGIRYLKTKWVLISIVSMLGALAGLVYAIEKKPVYLAVSTFVLEDPKSGGIGQYGGLAALAGLSLGGGGGAGIFQGDNILELYKSRAMIEKTLLTICNVNGKKQVLIDIFIDVNHLRSKEKGDGKIGNIAFIGNPDNFSRTQDSIITALVGIVNDKVLTVTKPDKKLSIINVSVESENEVFSKCFADKIVETVNDFYIQTKTRTTSQSVQVLQHQADSVKLMLNTSINGVASAIDAAPNANPQMSSLRVTSQKKQVDVQANTAVYSAMVQSLELQKITLRQEMPLIQIIDKPVFPLIKIVAGKMKFTIAGMVAGFVLIVGLLTGKKIIKQL
jgi:hypothetical protein